MENPDTGRGYDCYFTRASEDVYPLPDPGPLTGPVTQWIIVPDTLQHSPDLRSGCYAYGSICVHDGEPLRTCTDRARRARALLTMAGTDRETLTGSGKEIRSEFLGFLALRR